MVHRLDEMAVEAGFLRPAAVLRLAPSRQSDQHHLPSPRLLPESSAHFVTVQSRQADIEEHHIRPEPLRLFDRGFSIVSGMGFMPGHFQEQRQRLGGVLVVVDDQDAPRQCRRFCGRRRRDRCRSGTHRDRQTDHEFAALPFSGAARLGRTTMQLDEPLHHRQPDAESSLGPLQRAIDLREHVEDAIQLV